MNFIWYEVLSLTSYREGTVCLVCIYLFCVCYSLWILCILLFGLFDLSFVAFPSVLWYCWLGLLTCKNRLPYNLYCVGGDVRHCFIRPSTISVPPWYIQDAFGGWSVSWSCWEILKVLKILRTNWNTHLIYNINLEKVRGLLWRTRELICLNPWNSCFFVLW